MGGKRTKSKIFFRYAFNAIGIACLVPLGLTFGLHTTAALQTELGRGSAEAVMRHEAEKYGVRGKVNLQISPGGLEKNLLAMAMKHPNNEDYIVIARKSYLKKSILKHEMVHIIKEADRIHTGGKTTEETIDIIANLPRTDFFTGLYNYTISEPRANLYALTDLLLP